MLHGFFIYSTPFLSLINSGLKITFVNLFRWWTSLLMMWFIYQYIYVSVRFVPKRCILHESITLFCFYYFQCLLTNLEYFVNYINNTNYGKLIFQNVWKEIEFRYLTRYGINQYVYVRLNFIYAMLCNTDYTFDSYLLWRLTHFWWLTFVKKYCA